MCNTCTFLWLLLPTLQCTLLHGPFTREEGVGIQTTAFAGFIITSALQAVFHNSASYIHRLLRFLTNSSMDFFWRRLVCPAIGPITGLTHHWSVTLNYQLGWTLFVHTKLADLATCGTAACCTIMLHHWTAATHCGLESRSRTLSLPLYYKYTYTLAVILWLSFLTQIALYNVLIEGRVCTIQRLYRKKGAKNFISKEDLLIVLTIIYKCIVP